MRSLRTRRTAAVLVIAVGLCAVLSAWTAPDSFTAILVPLWIVLPALSLVGVRRGEAGPGQQAAPFLSLLPSRAPPAR